MCEITFERRKGKHSYLIEWREQFRFKKKKKRNMYNKKAETRKWFKSVTGKKKKFKNVLKNCLYSNFKPINRLNSIIIFILHFPQSKNRMWKTMVFCFFVGWVKKILIDYFIIKKNYYLCFHAFIFCKCITLNWNWLLYN